MTKYKKVPTLCSKERRDVYKNTGRNTNVIQYYSRKGLEEFDKAIKNLINKNINK